MITQSVLSFLFIFQPVAEACSTNGKTATPQQFAQFSKASSGRKLAANDQIQPIAVGNNALSLEARLANLLLTQPANGHVVLSIPVNMKSSSYNPFGDGQTNAKMELSPNWKEKEFPAVGIQFVQANGSFKRAYQFHSALKMAKYTEVALAHGWFEVRSEDKKESFYFHFDPSIVKVDQFLDGIPAKFRTFAENRPAPNPAKINVGNAYAELRSKSLGTGYNPQPWYESSVHGRFPDKDGPATAVGGVFTWGIVDRNFGPFKQLYTCFEGRDEKSEREKGVPSGAGWHHIGDPAETILNTLENSPLPIAIARSHNHPRSALGLNHTITATWIQTNQVAITRRGEFHWYAIPYAKETCAEVWVHNCVPDLQNNWGFNCQGS